MAHCKHNADNPGNKNVFCLKQFAFRNDEILKKIRLCLRLE